MANTLEVVEAITKETLRVLHNASPFIMNCNQQFDKEYDNSGARIGSQLKIRLPNQYTGGVGAVATPQSVTDESVIITRATQRHIMVKFTSEDLTNYIDKSGVIDRVIRPAAATLASLVAEDCYSRIQKVFNYIGTPGTAPSTTAGAQEYVLNAGRKLTEFLAPQIDRTFIVNPAMQVTLVSLLASLYNSAPEVSKQYLTGRMKNALGFDWYSDPLIPVLTTGSDHGTVTVNGASQSGSSLITAGGVLSVGSKFTIANVNAVHPQTKASYGYVKQFAVLSTTDNLTYVISPPIITSGAKQNVNVGPVDGAAITVAGSASTNYPMNIAFTRDAFAYVGARLEEYPDSIFCKQDHKDGLSIRLWSKSDIVNDLCLTRMDVLYGFELIRGEEAVVAWGA